MKTLYMMKGLPASGKTTEAKALVETLGAKRVNRDDLREMLDNGKWSKTNEALVIILQTYILEAALASGKHAVVDDTNLNPKNTERYKDLARRMGAKFEVRFHDVPVGECIRRDLTRMRSVGKDVILGMYNMYLRPPLPGAPVEDPDKPDCVICDIDGTIAKMVNRDPFEWNKVGEDLPRVPVIDMVKAATAGGIRLFFVSGRDAICREATQEWLINQGFWGNQYHLLMRPEGDTRRDSIVKRELYEEHIKGKYNVVSIFDDRPSVIRECWHELGFSDRVFNVGTGEEF